MSLSWENDKNSLRNGEAHLKGGAFAMPPCHTNSTAMSLDDGFGDR
jgi:hypothetical protein